MWLCATQAMAHALNASAFVSAEGITGEAFYSDQSLASGVFVEVVDAQGQLVAEGKTDAHGRFNLPLDSTDIGEGLEAIVHGEEGHRAQVPVRREAAALSADSGVQALREDIARLERRLWWRDIVGAVGYLVGAFGLYALILSRRSKS